jgi:hypothetical protein
MSTVYDELQRCLLGLAANTSDQRSLFPSFVVVPDELVLEFDAALICVAGELERSCSKVQSDALLRIDRFVEERSGPNAMWDPIFGLEHPEWIALRQLAVEALAKFGWPLEKPSGGQSIYVGSAF